MANCSLCGRALASEGDPLSDDCGGDCWGRIGEIEAETGHPLSQELLLAEWQQGLRPDWNPRNYAYSSLLLGDFPSWFDAKVQSMFLALRNHPRYPQIRDGVAESVVQYVTAPDVKTKAAYRERACRELTGIANELAWPDGKPAVFH